MRDQTQRPRRRRKPKSLSVFPGFEPPELKLTMNPPKSKKKRRRVPAKKQSHAIWWRDDG
jgi:hypothetical protein